MTKVLNKSNVLSEIDRILNEEGDEFALHLASGLFQRTLEVDKKLKWLSSEDQLIETFFYLTSKEELCEALKCDMVSLYKRAKALGVVSNKFDTLSSYDLELALSLFDEGVTQNEIIDYYGISALTIPVNSLSPTQKAIIYQRIEASNFRSDPNQMDLF